MKSSSGAEDYPDPTVGALLRMAWLSFRERMYDRVREAGYRDLQPVHLLVFRYPTIEGMRPSQLADQMGMSKQGVNDLLRQLENMGYLVRRPDPSDGRARLISLTDRGEELMALLYEVSSRIAEEWSKAVGRRRVQALRQTLVDLIESERRHATP